MSVKRRATVLAAMMALGFAASWIGATDQPVHDRAALMKDHKDGNFKDAYDGLRKVALDPKADPRKVVTDFETAIDCLQKLGQIDEIDEFREGVVAAHARNWRLLQAVARSYQTVEHHGWMVAGKFSRGRNRGNEAAGDGPTTDATRRDWTRALQLAHQALAQTKGETDKAALANLHLAIAQLLTPGGAVYLTDLSKLPDYEEGQRDDGQFRGAAVDADNNPIYPHLPKDYDQARNDGERWRWLLAQAVNLNPARRNDVDLLFAGTLARQYGVNSMLFMGLFLPLDDARSGTFALSTLGDDETIARLATGLKRFKVPDEFNWVKIYQQVAARGKSAEGESARDALASVFENRRQYVKAAAAWKQAIAEYGAGKDKQRQARLDQIVKNWAQFEFSPGGQVAGTKATVDVGYRNGNKMAFVAHSVNVPKLLGDVKAYLKSAPNLVDASAADVSNVGHRLVEQQQAQYLGAKVAAWDLELKPRPEHFDSRTTVKTPLDRAGTYFLTGQMHKGNLSRAIIRISDTVIVKKVLERGVLYYVADAALGQPIAKADVEFFGWHQVQIGQNSWRVTTTEFTETTSDDGQVVVPLEKMPNDWRWLITARKAKAGKDGADRFAYLGFTAGWSSAGQREAEHDQVGAYFLSDRPVYRPNQKVHYKFWVRRARFDQGNTSEFAGQKFTLTIRDPRDQTLVEKQVTADEFGGIAGEQALAASATLGAYNVELLKPGPNPRDFAFVGNGTFRVEEYKKPEFEVQVEGPKEPVMLGDRAVATVKARYYFGAPVTSAKVKYKVTRTTASNTWFPAGKWDWLYGPGYGWFGHNYGWYPGFMARAGQPPLGQWWGWQLANPPEIVVENEVSIGADGVVRIPIDTLPAKELHGNEDHQYSITAEVVDESRRTIVGTGTVLAAREPFGVFAWVDRGHYRVGSVIESFFDAHALDGKPVAGKGELTLYKITSGKRGPVEKAIRKWELDTDAEGKARQQLKASAAGQYRLAYRVTDSRQRAIEGGLIFVVRGEGFDGGDVHFNDVELVPDRREYAPGDKVRMMVNTNTVGGVVLLFVRPENGVYQRPKTLRLAGKSIEEEIAVVQRDMPNFFVEAVSVAGGRVHTEVREVIVPPEKRVLNVEVLPSRKEYKPGQKATVKVKLTDYFGKPFEGSTVLTMYDKSVEYVAGGWDVPEIREFFWKYRRHHNPQTEGSVIEWTGNVAKKDEVGMAPIGTLFGGGFGLQGGLMGMGMLGGGMMPGGGMMLGGGMAMGGFGRMGMFGGMMMGIPPVDPNEGFGAPARPEPPGGRPMPTWPRGVQSAVRKHFVDTAVWAGALKTNKDGIAEVSLAMPENLTAWKVRVWAMGHGTRVGQGEAEVVTRKDLIVRLQAPAFFVQNDEVVLSANVHNYLKTDKQVSVSLELGGNTLVAGTDLTQRVTIPSQGEKRIDWRVRVQSEGEAIVRMKAITDEESDAMEMRFPCHVHGMLKMDSYSGVVRPEKETSTVTFTVPAERRVAESRLEVRYSPTLAGAMVDALPYLVDYPYGCTEQTLNRFLPAVVSQRALQRMNVDLKAIRDKRTNLNAQEIGDDKERAKGWKRFERNPVFDEEDLKRIVQSGIARLAGMQCADGGWGWFSGWGERSWPHTTAVVVHGLQLARQNDVKLPDQMLERGIAWLESYQTEQVRMIKNAPANVHPAKATADDLDAYVYGVLAEEKLGNDAMRDFLYRDRVQLSLYAKAMFGLALHQEQQAEKLAMILKNLSQFLVEDKENQTAYLKLPGTDWWYWYASEVEANACYLKLLSRTNAKDARAAGLVKYLLNNRKHSTYWDSTRDTALCIEAFADYLKNSGEDRPNMTVEVWLDGKKHKEVKIDPTNLFTYDNKFVLTGAAVESGKHVLELRKKGTGPVYFNAYVTNFTLEDFITKAGLEVKVNRKYYKMTRVADATIKVPDARNQGIDQKVEKFRRTELSNLAELKSGDVVEVELEIDSKNDYEYVLVEDPKPAGCETVLIQSGYGNNDMGAYVEVRDDRVCFFVRVLARGKHSVSYRLRAEIPGQFSALPSRAAAMYAPELKGNSDEIKLKISD